MAKIRTLEKRKAASKKGKVAPQEVIFHPFDPLEYLLNKQHIANALLECIRNNDPESFIEVMSAYVEALQCKQNL